MARILLSAYAAEPGRGSEPEVGWVWATELARLGHSVTVVTCEGNHRNAIEDYAIRVGGPDFTIVYLDFPWPRRRTGFVYLLRLHQWVWQILLPIFLRKRLNAEDF